MAIRNVIGIGLCLLGVLGLTASLLVGDLGGAIGVLVAGLNPLFFVGCPVGVCLMTDELVRKRAAGAVLFAVGILGWTSNVIVGVDVITACLSPFFFLGCPIGLWLMAVPTPASKTAERQPQTQQETYQERLDRPRHKAEEAHADLIAHEAMDRPQEDAIDKENRAELFLLLFLCVAAAILTMFVLASSD